MAKGTENKLTVSFAFGCDACGRTNDIAPGDVLCARCKPAKKTANDNDLVLVELEGARSMGAAIPAPTTADNFTADEVAQWHANQRTLNADPRTAGDSPRPAWLVERVLRETSWTKDEIAKQAADVRELVARRLGDAS